MHPEIQLRFSCMAQSLKSITKTTDEFFHLVKFTEKQARFLSSYRYSMVFHLFEANTMEQVEHHGTLLFYLHNRINIHPRHIKFNYAFGISKWYHNITWLYPDNT